MSKVIEAAVATLNEKLRGGGFDAVVATPADASLLDRLVAYTGRTP